MNMSSEYISMHDLKVSREQNPHVGCETKRSRKRRGTPTIPFPLLEGASPSSSQWGTQRRRNLIMRFMIGR